MICLVREDEINKRHVIQYLKFDIPESSGSMTLFFLKSPDKTVDAKELEGENGGVIVETLDSGDILQSIPV